VLFYTGCYFYLIFLLKRLGVLFYIMYSKVLKCTFRLVLLRKKNPWTPFDVKCTHKPWIKFDKMQTDHFRSIKKNICCTKLFVKNIPKILSFILLDDHLSNSLFKFNALWNRTFFDGLGILKPQCISFYFIYNSACNNKTPTEVIFMHLLERRAPYYN
jgi:hypothetical protein